MTTYRLQSTAMLNTAGLFRWSVNGYRFPRDRAAIRRVWVEGFELVPEVVDGLLKGDIPHVIEGEDVVFEYEGKARKGK